MLDDLELVDKLALLGIARASIRAKFDKAAKPLRPEGSQALDEPCGAFVTLHKQGQLRGCVGYVESHDELWMTVREVALLSAFGDSRFNPLKEPELALCDIEISVLSPFEQCPDPALIEVGKHGLMIKKGFRSGLLLPQVPTEWGWDRETFLEHTCNKAGLNVDAWKDKDATILWFTAIVFGEKELGLF